MFSSTTLLLLGFIAFIVCLTLIPVVKRLAKRYDVMAYPGGHSAHREPIPLLGGAAMFAGVAVVGAIILAYIALTPQKLLHPTTLQMLSLFVGGLWMVALGIIDDKKRLSWKKKIAGQLLGVFVLILGGHGIDAATLPVFGVVDFGLLGKPLFALAVLTITNAVNLIDGVDGLAGGVCFFAALVVGVIGALKGDVFAAGMGFGIAGAVLGFLCFNFPPASIFMGDAGSLFLGFVLGAMATSSAATTAGQRSGVFVMLLAPFFPFGVALLDVALSVIRRSIAGRKVFFPDKDHLHHRLMEKVGSPRAVVVILYCFSAGLSAMTLTLILGPGGKFLSAYVVLSGVVLFSLVAMVLRLYMRDSLTKVIDNRPHFQFLAAFMAYMRKRALRINSVEEALSLLEAGVRDLDFDTVEVIKGGRHIHFWVHPDRVHPEKPREQGEVDLPALDLLVRWSVPIHDSESYCSYLKLVWAEFLKDVEERLHELTGVPRS